MSTAPGPRSTANGLAVLRDRRVSAFVAGRMASALGTQFVTVAVGWELYERTNDPLALGLTGLFSAAPIFLLMIPAGHAADRFPRRNVAMVGYALFALAALGLALVSATRAPVEIVYGLLLVIGGSRAFASPSVDSLLPQLIPPRQLANAQAWLASGGTLASIGGPPIGGLLIAIFGVAVWTYVVAAGAGLVFVTALATLPSIAPKPSGRAQRPRDLFAGLGFIRRSQVFLAAMSLDLFAVLFGGAVAALFGPVFSVVSGGVGTLAVVGAIALVWPALARLGPIDTLHPEEPATHAPSPEGSG